MMHTSRQIASLRRAMRSKRMAENLSLRQLGPLLGVSFSTLARFERDEGREPMPETWDRIAKWVLSDDYAKEKAQEARLLSGDCRQAAQLLLRLAKRLEHGERTPGKETP